MLFQFGFSLSRSFMRDAGLLCAFAICVSFLAAEAQAVIQAGPLLQARAEVVANGLGNPPVIDTANDPAYALDTLTNGSVTSTAEAQATYGNLKARGTISKTASPEPFNFATGTAQFTDFLTISGGSGMGTVFFEIQLDGSLTDVEADVPNARLEFQLRSGPPFYTENFETDSGQFTKTINQTLISSPLSFTYDVPFELTAELRAEVSLEENQIGTATADFFSTASFTAVTVQNATGPVTISSDSGTNYGIPEPSTMVLALFGGIALGLRQRKF